MKRSKSITHRFIWYLIIIIIASNCLIFSFQYYITQKNTKNQSIEMGLNLMDSNLTMIEQYFVDIDNIAYSLIYNREIVKFLKNDVDKAADLDWLMGVQSLYYNSRPDLKIYFYKEGKYDDVYAVTQTGKIQDYRYEKWYQELLWNGEDKILLSATAEIEQEKPEFVQSIIYKIYDIYSDNVVGYLKIDMDLESLKEKFLHSYSKIAGTTITDENGNVLFYDKLIIQLDDSVYEGRMTGVYEAEDYIMSYGTSKSTGWRVCMAMSRSELFRNQYLMVRTLLIVLLAILVVTFAVSGRFFSIITVNFTRLVDGMKQVKKGNLQIQVEADTQDEIGMLISEFNEMLIRLNELIAAVEAKQILLNEAEIKALQQQINPHFMHNIMATIMGLASEGMNDEVIEVSECMSNMLRYNTHFENTTTLREEVEQIQNYVKVLKIRFEDRFEVF